MHKITRIVTAGIVMLVLGPMLACGIGGLSAEVKTEQPQTEQPSTDTPTSAPHAKTYELGDLIEIEDWTLAAVGWDLPAATDYAKPESGMMWVRINVAQVNRSSDVRTAGGKFSLKDSQGAVYETADDVPTLNDELFLGGDLQPGERELGTIGFDVPKDATGFQLAFDPLPADSGDVATINLGDTPATASVPDSIDGEKELTTHPHNKPLDFEGLQLTILKITYPPGSASLSPHTGHRFISIHVSLKNTSDSSADLTLASFVMFELRLPNGARILPSVGYNIALKLKAITGTLNAGATQDGYVIGELPDDVKGVLLVYNPNLREAGSALIALDN